MRAKQFTLKVSENNYRLLESVAGKESCSMNEAVTKLFDTFRSNPDKVTMRQLVDTDTQTLALLGKWYLEKGRDKQFAEFTRAEVYKSILGLPVDRQKAMLRQLA